MAADILLVFFSFWLAIALLYHHGSQEIPLIGMTIVEMLGGYLMGRVLIREAKAFKTFTKYLLLALAVMLPFAVIELLTGENLWVRALATTFDTIVQPGARTRIGLFRVTNSFEHPILFGLFCIVGFGNALLVYTHAKTRRFWLGALAGGMAFMSLSSGPILGIAVQVGLLVWARLTGGKWVLLFILLLIPYVIVDMLSNRTPVTILFNYLTFDPRTAWGRLLIWDFGVAAIKSSPIFGIGLNEWERPLWLGPSVDNFWLLIAMRYGLPGIVSLGGAVCLIFIQVARATLPSNLLRQYRMGYIVSLIGLIFTLCTVHAWGNMSTFIMLYFGAGVFFFTTAQADGPEIEASLDQNVATRAKRPHNREESPYMPNPTNDPHQSSEPENTGRPQTAYTRFGGNKL